MRDTHPTSECSQKCGPRKITAWRQKTSFGPSFFAIVLEIESTLFADREMTGRWREHTAIFQNVRKIRQKLVPHFSYTFGHDFSLTVYSPLWPPLHAFSYAGVTKKIHRSLTPA